MARLAAGLLLFLLLVTSAAGFAEVPVPALRQHVTDQTQTLTASEIAQLDQRLLAFEREKGSQIVILIVPTTLPESIEQYSMRVVEAWKLGRKGVDDGVLFLIAKDDRQMRLEVGYGLEGALPDITAKRIIDDVVSPHFRNGNFSDGISQGVDYVLAAVRHEPLPLPSPQSGQGGEGNEPFMVFFVGASLVLAAGLRKFVSRPVAAVASGALAGALAWVFFGFLFALIVFALSVLMGFFKNTGGIIGRGGRSGGGGWSGGGGGRFGGGGASGRW